MVRPKSRDGTGWFRAAWEGLTTMSRHSVWLLGGALCLLGSGAGAVPSLTTLYTFHGPDGANPSQTLALDLDGNLYGTTNTGGPGTSVGSPDGYGTLFELSGYNHFKFRTVLAFDSSDHNPYGGQLVFDKNNNLFGTTGAGGPGGNGLVYELAGNRHDIFTDLADVGQVNGLVFDTTDAAFQPGVPYRTGDLVGATKLGGAHGTGEIVAFSGEDHRTIHTLYDVASGQSPNAGPNGPMIADAFGNLFGTTGGLLVSAGTVFELSGSKHQTYTTLATLDAATTGAIPVGGLSFDRYGNLYGVTQSGGAGGGGTLFELSGADHRHLAVLYSFGEENDPDGAAPNGPLAIDSVGNIFGTAYFGGISDSRGDVFGVIFKMSSDHQRLTIPYRFTGGSDGAQPLAGLIADRAGNLYGTTGSAGQDLGQGTVFKLSNVGFRVSP